MNGGSYTANISYFGDVGTGSITGGNDVVLHNFIFTSVPEPGSWFLLGITALGTTLYVQRQRRRTQATGHALCEEVAQGSLV